MKEFVKKLMVLILHRFQSAHQILSNSVVGIEMISTRAFLHFVFLACLLTCGSLAVQRKSVLSVLYYNLSLAAKCYFLEFGQPCEGLDLLCEPKCSCPPNF